ncbi:MAG: hypothetical protein OEV99_07285 [Nitrospira sp.]|nr:hypothetical protein [Nitrospira sp.]MDH4369635.1 hypothetical protein [Nitrospira sp.]MDH5497155.1 hypothetical protein [Nitrospira sp.]MDH5726561.1 hypothetical protein [Nitrospira sp.]
MSCTRCQGLMLEEQMIDMEASYGEMWVCARRYVNCGYRQDAVMQQHRLAQAPQQLVSHHVVTVRDPIDLAWESESVDALAA